MATKEKSEANKERSKIWYKNWATNNIEKIKGYQKTYRLKKKAEAKKKDPDF